MSANHPASTLLRRTEGLPQIRLVVYGICLTVAFGLYLLVHGIGRGIGFWLPAVAVSAGLLSSVIATDRAWRSRVLRLACLGALSFAAAIPLGASALGHDATTAIVANAILWPQILVALFASRVLAEESEARFAVFWREPFRAHATVQIQSIAAALALGLFFTLVFYQVASAVAGSKPDATSMSAIIVAALLGDTAIHRSIIFLFFVLVAAILDAIRLYFRDRAAIASLRRAMEARPANDADALRVVLSHDLVAFAHTRAIHLIGEALDLARRGDKRPTLAAISFAGFHQASRRFVRGLLPILPLLGFFGTVVGLVTAIAALTGGLGAGPPEKFDIAGSLAGLAIKFETTLLGLLASMIASLALAVLEKKEAELAAECSLLVDVFGRDDAR